MSAHRIPDVRYFKAIQEVRTSFIVQFSVLDHIYSTVDVTDLRDGGRLSRQRLRFVYLYRGVQSNLFFDVVAGTCDVELSPERQILGATPGGHVLVSGCLASFAWGPLVSREDLHPTSLTL